MWIQPSTRRKRRADYGFAGKGRKRPSTTVRSSQFGDANRVPHRGSPRGLTATNAVAEFMAAENREDWESTIPRRIAAS